MPVEKRCAAATAGWGDCCLNARWKEQCLDAEASPLVFTQNFAELLASRLRGLKIEDALLLACVPADAYWKQVTRDTMERHQRKPSETREAEANFEHLVRAGWEPLRASLAALSGLGLEPPSAILRGPGLLAGEAEHAVVLWGFPVQAEPTGWVQRAHRVVRRNARAWGRTVSQLRAAAIPASLAVICSLVASTVSLASSQLLMGQLHGVARALLAGAFSPSVARQLAKEGVYYASFFVQIPGESWEDLRKVLSLFLVPNVLALLRSLFPRAAASNASTVQLMLVSTGEVLQELARGGPKLIGFQQDLAAAFTQHVAGLGFIKGTAGGARVRTAASVAAKVKGGLFALRDADSPVKMLRGIFSLAGAMLFAYNDSSVLEVARRANVMMSDLVTVQAKRIMSDARLVTLHTEATKAAWASGQGTLLTWDEVSRAEAAALGKDAPEALTGARAVADALSSGYMQELRESLDASCGDARVRLGAIAREWTRTGEQLLFPAQGVGDSLGDKTAAIVRDMAHCASCAKAAPWPNLFAMDPSLSFEVERFLRESAQRAPTPSHGRKLRGAKARPPHVGEDRKQRDAVQ